LPKMFIHAPSGVFSADTRAQVAAELTVLGMACERLADTEMIRSGVWVFFAEHASDAIFSGGKVAAHPMMALLVNAIKGGLDESSKTRLIEEATGILRRYVADGDQQMPVYVAVQEIPESNWGMYGKQVVLSAMRAPGSL
jgi:phenylpyruvate tautomerase PptA (4-oxalocrotonate tautomerase family)